MRRRRDRACTSPLRDRDRSSVARSTDARARQASSTTSSAAQLLRLEDLRARVEPARPAPVGRSRAADGSSAAGSPATTRARASSRHGIARSSTPRAATAAQQHRGRSAPSRYRIDFAWPDRTRLPRGQRVRMALDRDRPRSRRPSAERAGPRRLEADRDHLADDRRRDRLHPAALRSHDRRRNDARDEARLHRARLKRCRSSESA